LSSTSESMAPAVGKTGGARRRPPRLVRIVLGVVAIVAIIFIAIQFVPVNRTNPPVTTQINWDSPQTAALAKRACMDCHSNETVWPWYSYVAPASWLIYYDTERGRQQLNLSTLGTPPTGGPGAFSSHANDLAYRVGQILAGGGEGEGGEGREFRGERPPQTGQEGQAGQQRPAGRTGGAPRNSGAFAVRRIEEAIQNGSMPPDKYTLIHPAAKLTDAERQQLLQGLTATLSQTSSQ
jgi:hypothetical protein